MKKEDALTVGFIIGFAVGGFLIGIVVANDTYGTGDTICQQYSQTTGECAVSKTVEEIVTDYQGVSQNG